MSAVDRKQIVRLRGEGLTYAEIQGIVGCSKAAVSAALKAAGMVTPYRRPLSERFWEKVEKTDTCWLWTSGINPAGYGQFQVAAGCRGAHRIAYELTVGPIPDGRHLDHLCRVRRCVRPDHLEPVTPGENVLRSPISLIAVNARKTRCVRGHDLSSAATRSSDGARICQECRRMRAEEASTRVPCPDCGKELTRGFMRRHRIAQHAEVAA